MSLANYKEHRQPVNANVNTDNQTTSGANVRTLVRLSQDRFWFYIWLAEKVTGVALYRKTVCSKNNKGLIVRQTELFSNFHDWRSHEWKLEKV